MKTINIILVGVVIASLFNLYMLGLSFYLVYVYEKNNKDTCNEEFKKVHRMWHPSMIAFGVLLIINSTIGLYFILKEVNKNVQPNQVRRSGEIN